MDQAFLDRLATETFALKAQGLFKAERVITSPQQAEISVQGGGSVLNFCANNYLGLSDHPALVEAARDALIRYGFGMSSVRFICGTQDVHHELERALSEFLGTDETILYGSCFDANGGLFETLLTDEDAVISDALNHASIIDGIRLSKARRFRYANSDMDDLASKLKEAKAAGARARSSSPPTASSRWTATSPSWTGSATWPMSTARWSWWTTATQSASWATADAAPTRRAV